jgi:hypothetical protein
VRLRFDAEMLSCWLMKLKNLSIATLAVFALISCGHHDAPNSPSSTAAPLANGALSRAQIDAYLSWNREMLVFVQQRMKAAPAMNDALVAAMARGQTEPPDEYVRYQQEGTAKNQELMAREPLTPDQRDAMRRTIAAITRIRPVAGAKTLTWEIYHNDPELDALRRDLGKERVNSIIEQEQLVVDSLNQ